MMKIAASTAKRMNWIAIGTARVPVNYLRGMLWKKVLAAKFQQTASEPYLPKSSEVTTHKTNGYLPTELEFVLSSQHDSPSNSLSDSEAALHQTLLGRFLPVNAS